MLRDEAGEAGRGQRGHRFGSEAVRNSNFTTSRPYSSPKGLLSESQCPHLWSDGHYMNYNRSRAWHRIYLFLNGSKCHLSFYLGWAWWVGSQDLLILTESMQGWMNGWIHSLYTYLLDAIHVPDLVLVTEHTRGSITDKNHCPNRTCSPSMKKEKEVLVSLRGLSTSEPRYPQVAPRLSDEKLMDWQTKFPRGLDGSPTS